MLPEQLEPVRIESRLISRIGVCEWGLPSMVTPGQIWRSERGSTIICMLPHPEQTNSVMIETRKLEVIDVGEMSWMPDDWRKALWMYVQEWPSSGCGLGPFLAISEAERNRFLRKMASRLLASDEIGCRHIAHDIGQFASLEFELASGT